VQLGGAVTVNEEINTQVSEDIKRAEMLSLPILLVLLIVIFGGSSRPACRWPSAASRSSAPS
jgi:RND superfamily putative drug exporter